MIKKGPVICFFALFLVVVSFSSQIGFVFAEDNLTGNLTGNFTDGNVTTAINVVDFANVSSVTIEIRSFFPTNVNVGDVQLNINVKNIGTNELTNLGAFVSGDGFSSYDVIMIDSLNPQEKSYIIVNGNFRNAGAINLTIKINQEVFYKVVNVLDSSANINQENKAFEENVTRDYNMLKANYDVLEYDLQGKKDDGYDISRINLADLKGFVRDAQANILAKNFVQAQIKIDLANDEYASQKLKLESAKKISLTAKLKDNAVLFSTLAGAIITFFTLYELLRKKNEHLKEKIISLKAKEAVKKK